MIDRRCEGSRHPTHRLPSWYRDTLACGHTMMVEVLVPVPPEFRIANVLDTAAFCLECPAPPGLSIALSIVTASEELSRGVCSMCGQPVPCDDDGRAIEHDRVDIDAMLAGGAFDA